MCADITTQNEDAANIDVSADSGVAFLRPQAHGEDLRWRTGAAVAALAIHAALIAVLYFADRKHIDAPTKAQEIAVDLVEEPAPEKSEDKLAQDAAAPPAPAPPPAPAASASQSAPPPPPAAASAPLAAVPPASLRPPPPPPQDKLTNKPATRKSPDPKPNAVTADFPIAPDSFNRAAAPAADRETNDDYKGAVFAQLEKFKVEPAAVKAQGLQGAAFVSFTLDSGGNLVTLGLIRSTGNSTLDAEALALVRRAAPFPQPPPGVLLSFSPMVAFGFD
jgi:protein TonB